LSIRYKPESRESVYIEIIQKIRLPQNTAARLLSNSVKRNAKHHDQIAARGFLTDAKRSRNQHRYMDAAVNNKKTVNNLAISGLNGFFDRKRVLLIESGFRQLEEYSNTIENRHKAIDRITAIVDKNKRDTISALYGILKYGPKISIKNARSQAYVELLRGLVYTDKYMQSRSSWNKMAVLSMIKEYSQKNSPKNARKLLKTQSLIMASSENVFFGFQALIQLFDRQLSSSYK
jgi:hypothetical protein